MLPGKWRELHQETAIFWVAGATDLHYRHVVTLGATNAGTAERPAVSSQKFADSPECPVEGVLGSVRRCDRPDG